MHITEYLALKNVYLWIVVQDALTGFVLFVTWAEHQPNRWMSDKMIQIRLRVGTGGSESYVSKATRQISTT